MVFEEMKGLLQRRGGPVKYSRLSICPTRHKPPPLTTACWEIGRKFSVWSARDLGISIKFVTGPAGHSHSLTDGIFVASRLDDCVAGSGPDFAKDLCNKKVIMSCN